MNSLMFSCIVLILLSNILMAASAWSRLASTKDDGLKDWKTPTLWVARVKASLHWRILI